VLASYNFFSDVCLSDAFAFTTIRSPFTTTSYLLLFSIMIVTNSSSGDLVMVIGGKYKGCRAILVELKMQMVEIKLLPTLRQVRVMIRNVSLIPGVEKNSVLSQTNTGIKNCEFSSKDRDHVIKELLKIRESIDSLVLAFSKIQF
jgi:hypothetical protein